MNRPITATTMGLFKGSADGTDNGNDIDRHGHRHNGTLGQS